MKDIGYGIFQLTSFDILKNINSFKKSITNDNLLLLDSTNNDTNINKAICN